MGLIASKIIGHGNEDYVDEYEEDLVSQSNTTPNPLTISDIVEIIFQKYEIFPLVFASVNNLWRKVARRRASVYLATKFGIKSSTVDEGWSLFLKLLQNRMMPEICAYYLTWMHSNVLRAESSENLADRTKIMEHIDNLIYPSLMYRFQFANVKREIFELLEFTPEEEQEYFKLISRMTMIDHCYVYGKYSDRGYYMYTEGFGVLRLVDLEGKLLNLGWKAKSAQPYIDEGPSTDSTLFLLTEDKSAAEELGNKNLDLSSTRFKIQPLNFIPEDPIILHPDRLQDLLTRVGIRLSSEKLHNLLVSKLFSDRRGFMPMDITKYDLYSPSDLEEYARYLRLLRVNATARATISEVVDQKSDDVGSWPLPLNFSGADRKCYSRQIKELSRKLNIVAGSQRISIGITLISSSRLKYSAILLSQCWAMPSTSLLLRSNRLA